MKIIFLDIDGVLNSTRFWEEHQTLPMGTSGAIDPNAVALLDDIVVKTGALVVLSTAWRSQGREVVWSYLIEHGFTGTVIGVTPNLIKLPRHAEISEWLWMANQLGRDIERFVTIDDGRDAQMVDGPYLDKQAFVWTNHVDGLTRVGADLAIAHLGLPS